MPVKFRVKITKLAEHDIESIWAYIASDSATAADKFIRHLDNQLRTLEFFPLRCTLIPENEILNTQYRHLLVGHYRTLVRIHGKDVAVLRVIQGARLLDASLFLN